MECVKCFQDNNIMSQEQILITDHLLHYSTVSSNRLISLKFSQANWIFCHFNIFCNSIWREGMSFYVFFVWDNIIILSILATQEGTTSSKQIFTKLEIFLVAIYLSHKNVFFKASIIFFILFLLTESLLKYSRKIRR